MAELRVVHTHITRAPIQITDRPVWFDENGASEPLTPAEFAVAVGLRCFIDAATLGQPAPIVLPDPDPVLEGEALLQACRVAFGLVEGDGWFEWWDQASEVECIDLADDGMLDECHLIALWDYEGLHFNRPGILAALDNAITRRRPAKAADRINQALVKASAKTPNTKAGKKK